MHVLVVEEIKLGKPWASERGPWHQDYAKMNVRSLGDAMAMQRWNDEEIVNYVHAKAQCEWDKMVIVAKQCVSLPKPTLINHIY